MQILKGSAEPCWLEQEVKKGTWLVLTVFAFLVFSTAILVGYYWSHRTWSAWHWIPLLLLAMAWAVGCSKAYRRKEAQFLNRYAGQHLEQVIAQDLAVLSDDYVLVTNWSPGMGDIDAILFGPHGALVIEAKCYTARQFVRKGRWLYEKDGAMRRAKRSPLAQAAKGNKTVSERLRSLGFKCYVRSVVVLAKSTPFESDNPDVRVVSRPKLLDYVQSLDKGTKHRADELAHAFVAGKRVAA